MIALVILAFLFFAFLTVITLVTPKSNTVETRQLKARNKELEDALRQIFINPDQAQLYASIALENSTKPKEIN